MRPAAVHPVEADEWADLLRLVEEWLLHASDDTLADFAHWQRPDAIIAELGRITVRLRQLAESTP